jgi:hypothetical protein
VAGKCLVAGADRGLAGELLIEAALAEPKTAAVRLNFMQNDALTRPIWTRWFLHGSGWPDAISGIDEPDLWGPDLYVATCQRYGLRIIKTIQDKDYGLRAFVFEDPDGNRIDVRQPI